MEHKRIDFYRNAVKREGYHHSECSCGWNFTPKAKNAMARAVTVRAAFKAHLSASTPVVNRTMP